MKRHIVGVEYHHKRHVVVAVLLLALLASGIAWYSFFLNDFAVTPDMSGLACAVDSLAHTGEFSTRAIQPYGYEMCWDKTTYPVLQIAHAGLARLIPVESWHLVMFTGSMAFVFCVLGTFGLTFQITRLCTPSIVAALSAALSPALLRSQVLTPQNLFGYLLLLLAISIAVCAVQKNRRWILLLELPLLGGLLLIHDLSFGVTAVALSAWFVLVYLQQWRWKITLIVGAVGLLVADFYLRLFPDSLHTKLYLIFDNNFPGFYHPLWDHPAIWGYIITSFAAMGIVFLCSQRVIETHYKIRWLILIILIVPICFGQLPLIGIGLLPNRFVPFAWIGLSMLTGYAVVGIQKYIPLSRALLIVLLACTFGAQAVHAAVFIKDDIEGWSVRYRPEPDFVAAVKWLEKNHPNSELLGIQSAINQQILHAPLWYRGNITYYPWYGLNHRDITQFTASPSSPYRSLLEHPESADYAWLYGLYTFVTQPTSAAAKQAISTYGLHYFIEWKRSLEYVKIWKNVDEYPVIYENKSYVLYQLQ